jgi:hypothetical protein
MTKMSDNQLFRNFVSPDFCRELLEAGFAQPAQYYWKIYSSHTKLVTFAFDANNYYKEESELADEINPPHFLIRAYTLMDIEIHFPAYLITSNGANHFEVSIDDRYPIEPVTADRLPDAFAKMWIAGARKRFFKPCIINEGK